jgi:Sugar (and other) transporter
MINSNGVDNCLSSQFSAFVITKTFTNLKALLGDGETFWLFSGLSVLGTIFVFFVVPETKGKSLNEIQKMLSGDETKAVSSQNDEGQKN